MKKEKNEWIYESLIPVRAIKVNIGFKVPIEMDQQLTGITGYPTKEVSDIISEMRNSFYKCEEKVVMSVFNQYLGREPELTDAKRGRKIAHISFPDRYILCIDDNQLGMIIRDFKNNKVDFIPGLTVFNK